MVSKADSIMTTREQAIEMATDAGALRRNGEYCFTEELLLELIAIATNAALDRAAEEIENSLTYDEYDPASTYIEIVRSLKVKE